MTLLLSEYSRLKTLLFLTAPILLIAHVATIAFAVHTAGQNLKDYFKLQPSTTTSASMYWYRRTFGTACFLFALGAGFLIVNSLSDGLFDVSGGCTDPLIRSTIAVC